MMKKNSIYQSKKIIEERTSEAIGTAFTSIDIKQTGEDYEVQGIICRFKKVAKVTVTVNSNYEIKFWSLSGNTIEMVRSLIGEIDLGNIVSVSDPCYDRSIWCRTTLKDVMPGRWKVFACIDTLDSWGRRCYIIELYHESIQDSCIDENAWKTYGIVGVDSGTMSVFNDLHYRRINGRADKFENNQLARDAFLDKCYKLADSYAGIFEVEGKGVGVVCSSGIGDGGYPFYVHVGKDKYYDAIKISFM